MKDKTLCVGSSGDGGGVSTNNNSSIVVALLCTKIKCSAGLFMSNKFVTETDLSSHLKISSRWYV